MATFSVQVSIPYFTAIPEDVCTNTWHFDWLGAGEPNDASYDLCLGNLKSFYENIYSTGIGTMASYARPLLTRVKMYDLRDPKPRAPVVDKLFPLTTTSDGGSGVPPETAVCLSYHTEYQSGIAKASQRGRIYLGVIGGNCITTGTSTTFPTVISGFRNGVGTSAHNLCGASLADSWGWVVYSQKLAQSFAVAGGWIDDAIDTQRRRGNKTTTRALWTD